MAPVNGSFTGVVSLNNLKQKSLFSRRWNHLIQAINRVIVEKQAMHVKYAFQPRGPNSRAKILTVPKEKLI